ncbi:MAG: tRNA (N(6)-L-threonylcarbamoyladenosine(37)-C(2))-methylthiotransferase MtaB, partial [Flammeovirgaceae bacterium]
NFLNELDISYLHVFTYSERANTAAIEMEHPVPMKERNRRSKMLRTLSHKKRRAFYEESLGKHATVLFEADVQDGFMEGFTENYVRVVAKYDPLLVNELKQVQLININDKGLVEVEEPELVYEMH